MVFSLNINCLQYMKFVNIKFRWYIVSFSYHPPFGSRSVLDHPSFILRSFSVRESKIDRRTNGESSEARRRCIETLMGGEGKDDPNILVLQNAFEKTRKQMKVNALSINALSDNLNFPMFAHRCAQMAHSMCKPKPRSRSFHR